MELEEAIKRVEQIKESEYRSVERGYKGHKIYAEAIKTVLKELKDIHTDLQKIYVDMRINGSNYYADKLNKAMKGRLHWDKR